MIPFDRDASSADTLLTDLYLDAILAGRPFRGDDPAVAKRSRRSSAPAAVPEAATGPDAAERLDPAIRAAVDRLRHDLVRVHPSFRFEERLATRLAEAATALRVPTAVGAEGRVVPFRARTATSAGDPSLGDPVDGLLGDAPEALDGDRRDLARPLLIGGALTSAALSLAGAALVAWRRNRPGSPMARAARVVRTSGAAIARPRTLRGPRPGSAGRDPSWPREPSVRGFD